MLPLKTVLLVIASTYCQQIMNKLLELQDALISMKCCLCREVLSVPPIIAISEDGKQLKCGRCENVKKPFNARNFAFENIVKFFSFPCIYKDCNKMISWEDVESHELICEKKTIRCPIFYRACERIVQLQNLEEHMEQNHERHIFPDRYLTMIIKRNNLAISSVISNNQMFFVMIDNSDTPEVYVASLNCINECFTYDLKISSGICDDPYSVSIGNQPINKYDERDHCFHCITKLCNLKHHPHSKVNGNIPVTVNYRKIDLTHIKPLLGDISNMKYTIEIHPKKDFEEKNKKLVNENSTVTTQTNDSAVVDLLRKQLQCPICMEYMVGNIYNCQKGHVACSVCKIQLTECPSCLTKIGKSRCFPLENLADEIVLACLFSGNGCDFTGKLKLLSQHEKHCEHIIHQD
ncbi:unnamed protein product [Phaedon cochleariae]|uniref:E3 ubiquitin-protein ligase Sina-like RING finger domain-containing protein n=1 Tax=Phaedon cochleariae TaxID=80249 RepID=A0A9P0GUW6_PHACE|nr:unnamed protein product [Phaedon cochleariae]